MRQDMHIANFNIAYQRAKSLFVVTCIMLSMKAIESAQGNMDESGWMTIKQFLSFVFP